MSSSRWKQAVNARPCYLVALPVEIPVRKPFNVEQILKLFLCWTQKVDCFIKRTPAPLPYQNIFSQTTIRHIQSRHPTIYSYQTAVSLLKQQLSGVLSGADIQKSRSSDIVMLAGKYGILVKKLAGN